MTIPGAHSESKEQPCKHLIWPACLLVDHVCVSFPAGLACPFVGLCRLAAADHRLQPANGRRAAGWAGWLAGWLAGCLAWGAPGSFSLFAFVSSFLLRPLSLSLPRSLLVLASRFASWGRPANPKRMPERSAHQWPAHFKFQSVEGMN